MLHSSAEVLKVLTVLTKSVPTRRARWRTPSLRWRTPSLSRKFRNRREPKIVRHSAFCFKPSTLVQPQLTRRDVTDETQLARMITS